MRDPITLTVALEGRNCLTFDDDGSGKIKFTFSASEVAAAARLLTLEGQALTLSILPLEEKGSR